MMHCDDQADDDDDDRIQSISQLVNKSTRLVRPPAPRASSARVQAAWKKTHYVDKLLVHEIWDSKFRQNPKNIYCEHLVKWPKKQREMQISKNWSQFDVVMICKTCKLDSSILDVDPSARLTCNSIYENEISLQSYAFQGVFRLLL